MIIIFQFLIAGDSCSVGFGLRHKHVMQLSLFWKLDRDAVAMETTLFEQPGALLPFWSKRLFKNWQTLNRWCFRWVPMWIFLRKRSFSYCWTREIGALDMNLRSWQTEKRQQSLCFFTLSLFQHNHVSNYNSWQKSRCQHCFENNFNSSIAQPFIAYFCFRNFNNTLIEIFRCFVHLKIVHATSFCFICTWFNCALHLNFQLKNWKPSVLLSVMNGFLFSIFLCKQLS